MQRWEYCEISPADLGAGSIRRGYVLSFYGASWANEQAKAQDDAFGRDRLERIAQLGREGWELCGVEGARYIFKRHLP